MIPPGSPRHEIAYHTFDKMIPPDPMEVAVRLGIIP